VPDRSKRHTWTVTTLAGLDIKPLSPLIGAEIWGVDISRPLGTSELAAVREALNRHHVIFFREQELSPETQTAFASQFGEVTEAHPVIPAIEGHREVMAIDGKEDRASWWHTDVTFVPNPPLGSILSMQECPEVGGDTMWASLEDAYDGLSSPVRALCDQLVAVHYDAWFAAEVDAKGGFEWDGIHHDKLLPAIHPVVRTHPENGRNGLFVNRHFTQMLLGVSGDESKQLLELLYRQCEKPEYTCRFHWEPGSVAFWDNRATLHYALDDYGNQPRYAHRVTVRGDIPYGPAQPLPAGT
jgi:alpha-ketoglutarate-dependent taurine dioxygenase